MKKNIVALAVASAVAFPFSAMAEPKLYGKIHLNFGLHDETAGAATVADNWQVESYASRVGIKGDHDLGDGMKVTYKLEYEIDPDSGGSVWANRNQYLGLKAGFGEVRFGRHDTPLKMVQSKFDQFGDTEADLKHAGDEDGENRWGNTIIYLGKSGDFGYNVAIAPGEGDGTTGGDGIVDNISGSFSWKNGPFYVGAGMDIHDDTAGQESNTMMRLIGLYKMDKMQFGLMYQSGVEAAKATADEEDWIGLSFNMKLGGNNKIKAQYIMAEDNGATATENTLLAVGFDHKFSKAVTGYAMFSDRAKDQGSASLEEETTISVGMITKF